MLTKSGELLKSVRLKKGFTLEDVERATKIRVKFLRALEEEELDTFHSPSYARGFLKNYAEFLNLDSKLVLALFRRETSTQDQKIIPQGMVHNDSSWLRMTPTRAVFSVILIVLLAIGYYLFREYRGFLGTPALAIDKPPEQAVVKEGEMEVIGKTDIDTTILINGEPVTLDESGRFTKKIKVFKGETVLTVTAKNRRGKESTITRKIKVE